MADTPENTGPAPNDDDKTCLSFGQKFSYAWGQMAVSLSPAVIGSYLIYFYNGGDEEGGKNILLVSAAAMAVAGLAPKVIEAIAEPLIGHVSDTYTTRFGRRMPWIIFGTPLLMLFSVLIWFPPDKAGLGHVWATIFGVSLSPNFVWLVLMHTGFWLLYSAVVAPYLSLLPEITPYKNERIKLSEFMAYSDVLGNAAGTAGLGFMIDLFEHGANIGPFHLENAFEVSGLLIGAIFLVSFYVSISRVRERPAQDIKPPEFHFWQSVRETLRNPAFPAYVAASTAIRMGLDIVLAALPFIVVKLMNLAPGYAGYLQGVILLGSMFLFPLVSRFAAKRGKKKIFKLSLIWFCGCFLLLTMVKHFPFLGYPVAGVAALFGKTLAPSWISFAHSIVVLALCAFAVAVIFVVQRPILSDVIDHDEKLTGYRREAMYNGMEGFFTKLGSGAAYFIVPLLYLYFGATTDKPYGIIAAPLVGAVVFFIGWVVFRLYPIEQ
jgi:GPH family glycoside/pentoside/hexuronide:cation symporter